MQVPPQGFPVHRSAAKADIVVGADQRQTAIGQPIALCERAVWIVEPPACPPLRTAGARPLHDLIALYQLLKLRQWEVQFLDLGFVLLPDEDEQGMARARKPLEELVRRVPLLCPDGSIRSTVPSAQASAAPVSSALLVLDC